MLTPRKRLKIRCRNIHRQRYWEEYVPETYECPCGYEAWGIDGEFHVHPIDGDCLNGHFVNLVALCYHCHKHVHRAARETAPLEELGARRITLEFDAHDFVFETLDNRRYYGEFRDRAIASGDPNPPGIVEELIDAKCPELSTTAVEAVPPETDIELDGTTLLRRCASWPSAGRPCWARRGRRSRSSGSKIPSGRLSSSGTSGASPTTSA